MIRNFFLLTFLLIICTVNAQSNFEVGWLPKVNISLKISDKNKWVNSIETREVIYEDKLQFSHSLVDVSSIFSTKIDVNKSINLGYIIRFREGEVIHRLLQHFNWVQNFESLKLAHRLGFELFYQNEISPQYRTRYRLTLQKSLSGEKVDVKEFYIKLSNEYLYQFNQEDLEIRLSPYLGYQLSKKDKIEIGLDYRLGNVLESVKKNALWFRTTWYISI